MTERSGVSEFRLEGFRSDNLLASLALLGVVRTLESSLPDAAPRAAWRDADPRPVLALRGAFDVDAVASAVANGLTAFGPALDFDGRRNVDFTPAEFRNLLASVDAPVQAARRQALAALGADGIATSKGDRIGVSPFVMIFGQGHQHFLERWTRASRTENHAALVEALKRTLFGPWNYSDRVKLTFRWDPSEDRRHALRADDPSGSETPSEEAANRLAAIGLTALTAMPDTRSLLVPGVHRRGANIEFAWPIWTVPLGLGGILALYRHPAVVSGGNRPAGVSRVMVAQRLAIGKLASVSPGRPR